MLKILYRGFVKSRHGFALVLGSESDYSFPNLQNPQFPPYKDPISSPQPLLASALVGAYHCDGIKSEVN